MGAYLKHVAKRQYNATVARSKFYDKCVEAKGGELTNDEWRLEQMLDADGPYGAMCLTKSGMGDYGYSDSGDRMREELLEKSTRHYVEGEVNENLQRRLYGAGFECRPANLGGDKAYTEIVHDPEAPDILQWETGNKAGFKRAMDTYGLGRDIQWLEAHGKAGTYAHDLRTSAAVLNAAIQAGDENKSLGCQQELVKTVFNRHGHVDIEVDPQTNKMFVASASLTLNSKEKSILENAHQYMQEKFGKDASMKDVYFGDTIPQGEGLDRQTGEHLDKQLGTLYDEYDAVHEYKHAGTEAEAPKKQGAFSKLMGFLRRDDPDGAGKGEAENEFAD